MSTKSGNWSDPSVWNLNHVPRAMESVHIGMGHTIVYDVQSDEIVDGITIHGKLYFSRNTDTRLKTDNHIMVHDGGDLNIGTYDDPIPRNITSEIIFTLTQAQADAYIGGKDVAPTDIGLMAMSGSYWNVHGAPLRRTWSKLNQNAPAGTNSIIVENDVTDWYVGGDVVVSGTNLPRKFHIRGDGRETSILEHQHEQRKIVSLEKVSNGTRITLDQPLTYLHEGTAPFRGEVALLTRNILITTEIIGRVDADYTDVRNRKFAHTMYMKESRGDLAYTEFKYMGHYGAFGRYATHHHLTTDSSKGYVIRGNSMWRTGFRCVNIHAAYGILIEDNVCYDAQSVAYMVEPEEGSFNKDNAFVHNIAIDTKAKHFNDRNDGTISGEARRVASFWPGEGTVNESFLGNVVAGGTRDTNGFHFPSSGNSLPQRDGIMPFTFIANEVHSTEDGGIDAWQNVSYQREIVGSYLWRNGHSGISWGAYGNPFHIFNTKALENGQFGFNITSVQAYIQDSEISVADYDNSVDNYGIFINGYIQPQYPNPAVWLSRNTFKNIAGTGIAQAQKILQDPDQIPDVECSPHDFPESLDDGISLKERPVFPSECSATYTIQLGNVYQNVTTPIHFGDQPNPNSWWKVLDYTGTGTTRKDYVLVREDQQTAARQGVITKHLVNSATTYNSTFDALLTPLNSLPAEQDITGLYNWRSISDPAIQNRSALADFTFKTTDKDYPPSIQIQESNNNGMHTIAAQVTDDRGIDRVEFFVDWIKVDTKTNAPYTVTVDLSNHPRKYAYLYAVAYDGTKPYLPKNETWSGNDYEQRAYSNIIELGPEVLGMGTVPTPTGGNNKPGDTNNDNLVNLTDLSTLLSNFGKTGDWTHGNFNTDTLVNLTDLSTLLSNFGK